MGSSEFDGALALVTGAARGIGAATARVLARRGAHVLLGDVLDVETRQVADDIGDNASTAYLDVTSEASWSEVVEAATTKHGPLEVLVNNAGIARMAPLAVMPPEQYREVIEVNQVGVFLGMQASIPSMVANGRGSIINISSVDGLQGTPGMAAYVASKFAVRGMTKVAALELGQFGIRVNSVHPGATRTPMLDAPEFAGFDVEAAATRDTPLNRIADATEIAEVIAFLASDASSYCTGAEFVVDGGLTSGVAIHLDEG